MDTIVALGPWAWLIAGLILIGLETLVPGVFFFWLGIAAILTGVADWLFGLSWQHNLLGFAVLSVASVLMGRWLTKRADERVEDNPMLNRRGDALVGRVFPLDRPIVSGEGRIRVDDTVWRVIGPDMAAGASVRVIRVEGTALIVEAAPA